MEWFSSTQIDTTLSFHFSNRYVLNRIPSFACERRVVSDRYWFVEAVLGGNINELCSYPWEIRGGNSFDCSDGGCAACINLLESDDVRYHTEVIAAQCKWSLLIPPLRDVRVSRLFGTVVPVRMVLFPRRENDVERLPRFPDASEQSKQAVSQTLDFLDFSP